MIIGVQAYTVPRLQPAGQKTSNTLSNEVARLERCNRATARAGVNINHLVLVILVVS